MLAWALWIKLISIGAVAAVGVVVLLHWRQQPRAVRRAEGLTPAAPPMPRDRLLAGRADARSQGAARQEAVSRRLHASRPLQSEPARSVFVIEDHGSGGALLATGLLAPGAAALLSIGVVHMQAVAIGDALQARPMAYLGLTYDPHVVDEDNAGKFMAELKRLLEVVSFS